VIQRCEFNRTKCEAGLDGLMAWEFEWHEENNVFSREPLHNWASHPSDAFAYGCQVMKEQSPPDTEQVAKHYIQGTETGMQTVTLNELWDVSPGKSNRI
jgi:phage terminase large subunit